jgi:hypothetical protein
VADLHRLIVRKVVPQTLRNLLGTPRHTPSPLLSRPMPASLPRHDRPANRSSVLGNDLAGQPILHIRPQRRVDRKFCTLWSTCRPLSVPLRRARPILETAASRRRVAPQFSRDGRCSSTKSAGDLSHSQVLCKRERDLLPLGKC